MMVKYYYCNECDRHILAMGNDLWNNCVFTIKNKNKLGLLRGWRINILRSDKKGITYPSVQYCSGTEKSKLISKKEAMAYLV